jgi:hypothetical protein
LLLPVQRKNSSWLGRISLPYLLLLAAVFAAVFAGSAPSYAAEPAKRPLPLHSAIEDKNFYLLSLLASDPEVHRALIRDAALSEVSTERERRLKSALESCNGEPVCTINALVWTEDEIRTVSAALSRLYHGNPALEKIVDGELRSSGAYVLDQQKDGQDLIVSAWTLCAHGLNNVLLVYGEGTPPRYPQIDSISFDVHSSDFRMKIASLAQKVSDSASKPEIFFEPSLEAARQLLALNHRDEAGRFEPMEQGVNKAAVQSIPSIRWANYPYSVIVVPGAGPSDPNTPLSDAGRKRIALAVASYREGKAPFILTSGGYVHPSQTRFSEAIEMKRALLDDYHIPEKAILVDPHARHTTTNMRNAVREIYRYGIPMDKLALVVSDPGQTAYIAGKPFADRCRDELGYLPYKIVEQTSATSLTFMPMIESLEQNPLDPLDP